MKTESSGGLKTPLMNNILAVALVTCFTSAAVLLSIFKDSVERVDFAHAAAMPC